MLLSVMTPDDKLRSTDLATPPLPCLGADDGAHNPAHEGAHLGTHARAQFSGHAASFFRPGATAFPGADDRALERPESSELLLVPLRCSAFSKASAKAMNELLRRRNK